MSESDETFDRSWTRKSPGAAAGPPVPGLITIFSCGQPMLEAKATGLSAVTIGRGEGSDLVIPDTRLSRRHAEIRFDGCSWHVRDLDSRNGTFLNGSRGDTSCEGGGLLSVGDTLLLLCDDVRPYLDQKVEVRGGAIVGPHLRSAWRDLTVLAQSSNIVHITGETGTGKELAARLFHEAGPRPQGPFIAVNCAAIPAALAEGLLFGARRGSYSGADKDSDGLIVSADGGTLFLDELAELSLEVQAKLLRAVETGEVLALGASRPRKVELRLCSATHGDLRRRVSEGAFREDLFFRIGRPTVELPPLRERRVEIPWIVHMVLANQRPPKLTHVSLVESALLRPWPGNIRELIRELEAAASRTSEEKISALHLTKSAGTADQPVPAPLPAKPLPDGPRAREILEALQMHKGNVLRTAIALGMHRNQLRRWLAQFSIDPRQFNPAKRLR